MKKPLPHKRTSWTVKQLRDIVSRQFFDGKPVEINHTPPLAMREGVSKYDGVHPNDPEHCEFVIKEEHRKLTSKVDVPMIAKNNRIRKSDREFQEKISNRQCGDKRQRTGTIQSRGFNKRKKS